MKKKIFTLVVTFLMATSCAGCSFTEKNRTVTKEEAHSFCDDDLRIGDIRDVANTEDGFYFIGEYGLSYYDNECKEATLLCMDSGCKHNSMDCNAFSVGLYGEIYYNNGKLYSMECVPGENGNYDFYLVEISKDATEITRLTKLFQTSEMGGFTHELILHRGYCYFYVGPDSYETEKENSVFRVKIEKNAKVETIYTDRGYGVDYSLIGYEDCVYIRADKYLDADGREQEEVLLIYDGNTGKIKSSERDDFLRITFGNGCMYFTTSDSLWKREEGKKEEKIYDFGGELFGELRFDGTYFYFDTQADCYMKDLDRTERKVYVIDQQGELKEILEIPFEYNFATCDKEKSVWKNLIGSKVGICYTKNIGSGKTRLEEIKQ